MSAAAAAAAAVSAPAAVSADGKTPPPPATGAGAAPAPAITVTTTAGTASDAARERGNVALKAGDLAGAVAAYSEAIAADPRDPRAWNNRALAHMKMENVLYAFFDAYHVAHGLEPGNAKVRTNERHARTRSREAPTPTHPRPTPNPPIRRRGAGWATRTWRWGATSRPPRASWRRRGLRRMQS